MKFPSLPKRYIMQLDRHELYQYHPERWGNRFVKITPQQGVEMTTFADVSPGKAQRNTDLLSATELDEERAEQDERVTLVFVSRFDYGAMRTSQLREFMGKDGNRRIIVCKWSDQRRLSSLIERTQRCVDGRLQEVIIWGHGNRNKIAGSISSGFGGSTGFFTEDTLSRRSVSTIGGKRIALASCSTGIFGGLAQKLSQRHPDLQVLASTANVNHMAREEDGEIHLRNKTHLMNVIDSSDHTVVYQDGKMVRACNPLDKKLMTATSQIETATSVAEVERAMKPVRNLHLTRRKFIEKILPTWKEAIIIGIICVLLCIFCTPLIGVLVALGLYLLSKLLGGTSVDGKLAHQRALEEQARKKIEELSFTA